MTLALAGVFHDSIVVGADTLTTGLNTETGKRFFELSHKIEGYRDKFAFIFAGWKYIPDLDINEGISINLIIKDLEHELGSNDPQAVFQRLTTDLTNRFNTYRAKITAEVGRFELAMLGYHGRRPFYWFYDYNKNKHGEVDMFTTLEKPYAIICCSTLDSYEPAKRGREYRNMDTPTGLNLIMGLLNDAYQRELESDHTPFINNRYDFAILSPAGFYWDTRQVFDECHFLTEAVKRIEGGTG